MKKISYALAFLALVSFANLSCKKKSKSDSDTNPNSNGSSSSSAPSCVLNSDGLTSTSYTSSDSYTYNSSGKVLTISNTNSYNSSVTTFTYDGDGNITKSAQSSSSYTTYEYTSGKISKSSIYSGGSLSNYTLYTYGSGTATLKQYTPSDQLIYMGEYTFSGNNISSLKGTSYNSSTGNVTVISQYTYTNYDSHYSADYFIQKTNPSLLFISQNNYQNLDLTTTVYTSTPNTITTSAYSNVYTYNTSGAVVKNVQTYTNSATSGATVSTLTYDYTGCN